MDLKTYLDDVHRCLIVCVREDHWPVEAVLAYLENLAAIQSDPEEFRTLAIRLRERLAKQWALNETLGAYDNLMQRLN